jgi:acyl phosphate:glycerol-3-phosphate acyltransferase
MNPVPFIALAYAIFIGIPIGSFLIGSIPWGYLIGRFIYHTDLRKSGSGNIGAMNALRTLGTKGAVAVLLLDAGKGVIPVLLVSHPMTLRLGSSTYMGYHSEAAGSIAATCAVLGHCFSPWLGWKGGKGVATAFGAIFALCWPAGLVCVAAWLLGALALTRYSSVGSMLAMVVAPFALFLFTRSPADTAFGVFAAVLILWTHRENIARLRSGTEGPITLFGSKS